MRGINRVVLSGVLSSPLDYATTGAESEVCSFMLESSRPGAHGATVTSFVKINAYSSGLVGVCRAMLHQGAYVIVEGELMNRGGRYGERTEVRARDIIFVPSTSEGTAEGT